MKSFKIILLLLILTVSSVVATGCAGDNNGVNSESNSEETTLPEITVILGCPSGVTVYEDDPMSVVTDALLQGTYTSTGKYTVKVRVLDENGKSVSTLSPGIYTAQYHCEPEAEDVKCVSVAFNVIPADLTPPVIEGVKDIIVELGQTPSYRSGVTAKDGDNTVTLSIDSSLVDLTKLGTYPVTYSATDGRGNVATATAKVMVVEPSGEIDGSNSEVCTKEELDALCMSILSEIIKDGMTDYQKAEAIFNRVNSIKYVSTDDDPSWIGAAYTGLTTGRGDCWNHASASKALLTLAGIPNYDMHRVGGTSSHFWQIVYIDGGWYHFDACPTLKAYYIRAFLLTEEEAMAYSERVKNIRPNYFVYDYENCPYEVVKSRT